MRSNRMKYRTKDGYMITSGRGKIALKCTCGEPECEGWAMVSDDPTSISEHKRLYGEL